MNFYPSAMRCQWRRLLHVFHIVTDLQSDASDQAQELQGLDRPDGHVQQHQVQETSGGLLERRNWRFPKFSKVMGVPLVIHF